MNPDLHLACLGRQHPDESLADHRARLAYRDKHRRRRELHTYTMKALRHMERIGAWIVAIALLLAVLHSCGHAQTTNQNVNVTRVGGSAVSSGTGIPVTCVSGCSASATSSTAVNDGTTTTQKATVDVSGNLHVNCAAGCAGGASTPADTFANPSTAGLQINFPMLWNGTSWDRWYGDKTNGGFVNIKNSVTLNTSAAQSGTWNIGTLTSITNPVAVTGTFWQATQPVSGTFFQATQPVSSTQLPAALDGSGFLKVHEQGTATVSGTVTANQGGTWNIGTLTSITNPVAVTGTFFQATQPVSGTVAATESGTWTVQPGNTANTTAWLVNGPTLTKGTQGAVGFAVQDLKDSGRTRITFTSDAVAVATTEGLVTFTKDVAGTATTAQSTYAVTAGKTFRVQSLSLSLTATSTTVARVRVRLRENTGGTCAASSTLVWTGDFGPPTGTLATGVGYNGAPYFVNFPDGLEFPAADSLCLSEVATTNTTAVLSVALIGYEY